jgi:hypothetical protein
MRLANVFISLGIFSSSFVWAQNTPRSSRDVLSAAVLERVNRDFPGQMPATCLPPRPNTPERSIPLQILPAGIQSIAEVAYHGFSFTDRRSNGGLVNYVRDSLNSDDEFFNSAFRFYSELYAVDQQPSSTGSVIFGRGAINRASSTDLWPLALRAAHGNAYQALRVMLVFGHDNMANALITLGDTEIQPCRFSVLNLYNPRRSSQLYLRRAIGAIDYTQEQVARGNLIARACNNTQVLTVREMDLCNDGNGYYQADYYHVIAAAFMGCRSSVQERSFNGAMTLLPFFARTDRVYFDQIKSYKIARFREEAGCSLISAPQISISPLLCDALERIEENRRPLLPAYETIRSRYTQRDYQAAQAIINRYEFEVELRLFQHRRGWEFGASVCNHQQSLSQGSCDLPL